MRARERHVEGVRSNVHVLGHPVHPVLVLFPVAFLVGALVTDLVYLGTADVTWAAFSYWLLWAGLVTGIVAALTGAVDFLLIPRVRATSWGWVHMVGNLLVLVLAAVNVGIRVPDLAITGGALASGVVLSAIIAATLVVTGWAGGELVYRHRVAVLPARAERPPRAAPGEERPAA